MGSCLGTNAVSFLVTQDNVAAGLPHGDKTDFSKSFDNLSPRQAR